MIQDNLLNPLKLMILNISCELHNKCTMCCVNVENVFGDIVSSETT